MKKDVIIWIGIFILLVQGYVYSEEAGLLSEKIDKYITGEMKTTNIPGLSITISKKGSIIHSKGYGIADSTGRLVNPQNPIVIGSLSKQITAYAILLLAEQKQLNLDDPVSDHLKWFSPKNSFDNNRITIEQLLIHTSGITAVSGVDFNMADADRTTTEQALLYQNIELNRPAGSSFEYSNTNYVLLGAIIESVSQTSFEEFIEENIFKELNMKNSYTSYERAKQKLLISGFRRWFKNPIEYRNGLFYKNYTAAMTLISSSPAYDRFLHNYYSGTGLSRDLKSRIHSSGVTAELDNFEGRYSYGFLKTAFENQKVYFCQGGYHSTRNYSYYLPGHGISVVLMMNMNTQFSKEGLKTIGPGVLSILLDKEPYNAKKSNTIFIIASILLVLVLIQGVKTYFTIRVHKSYYKNETIHLKHKVILILHSLIDISILYAGIFYFPKAIIGFINTLYFIQPDLTSIYIVLLIFIAAVLIVRIALLIRYLSGKSAVRKKNVNIVIPL